MKRKPSPYQKQIRFLTFFFGMLAVLLMVAVLLFMNRGPLTGISAH